MIVIEHDPMLYEDAQGMVEYVSQGLHDAAKEAAVHADRVFYFDEGPRATTKLIQKCRRARQLLEAL